MPVEYGLLGFVPDPFGDAAGIPTVPLLRGTNGITTVFSENQAELEKKPKYRAIDTSYKLFRSPAPNFIALDRYSRGSGPSRAFTYGAGPRAEALIADGWKKERTLGYISEMYFDGAIGLPIRDFTDSAGCLRYSLLGLPAISSKSIFGSVEDALDEVVHVVKHYVIDPLTSIFGTAPPDPSKRYLMQQKGIAGTQATVWIGVFALDRPPDGGSVLYVDATGVQREQPLSMGWQSSINDASACRCFYQEVTLKPLKTDSRQRATLLLRDSAIVSCEIVTLPAQLLPAATIPSRGPIQIGADAARISQIARDSYLNYGGTHFTVFLGSCFYVRDDLCRVLFAYTKLVLNHGIRPHLNLFVGDQVYLDAPWNDFLTRLSTDDLRWHFTEAYISTWYTLQWIHQSAANIFVSDDHEFYNDYPRVPPNLPLLNIDDYRHTWQSIAKKLFHDIQTRDPNCTFSIGEDLAFFVLDTRLNRTGTKFANDQDLANLREWISGLKCPGVIVSGQILFDLPGKTEMNLCDFSQYNELCDILWNAPHDILYLSGDVHFGRIARAPLRYAHWLYEVVSSPLSLVGDDIGGGAIAQFIAKNHCPPPGERPINFPQIQVAGIPSAPIEYIKCVRPKDNDPDRTAENFFTLRFSKNPSTGGVDAYIQAWLPRKNSTECIVFRDFERTLTLT